jgi:hypothetical protein
LTGEYIYFLYLGDVTTPVTCNETGSSNDVVGGADITHTSKDIESCVSDRIFGDIQFAKVFETSVYNKAMRISRATGSPETRRIQALRRPLRAAVLSVRMGLQC